MSQQPSNIHWDYAVHLNKAFIYIKLLQQGDWRNFIFGYFYYPPLIYWLFAWGTSLFGYTRMHIVNINFAFILYTLITVYSLAKNIFAEKEKVQFVLLATAVNFIVFLIFTPLWEMMLDLPLMCVVATTLFSLFSIHLELNHREGQSLKRRKLLLLGMWSGINLFLLILIKWTAPIYILLPVLFVALQLLHFRYWTVLLLMIVLPLLGILSWYIPSLPHLLADVKHNTYEVGILEHDPQFLQSLPLYVLFYIRSSYLFLLAGLIVFFSKKTYSEKKLFSLSRLHFLIAHFLLVLGILTFIVFNKDVRYAFPLYFSLNMLLIFYIASAQLRKRAQQLLTIFLPSIALAVFLRSLPPQLKTIPLTTYVSNFAQVHNIRRVYYFFEDDNTYFNYANMELVHQENNILYPEHQIMYKQLNFNGFSARSKSYCDTLDGRVVPDSLVVVYRSIEPSPQHIEFHEDCPQLFSQLHITAEYIDYTQGEVTLYSF